MLELKLAKVKWGTFLLILMLKQDMIDIDSLMERYRCRYEQTKRIYFDRAAGGDCHHCFVDGDIDAGIAEGP